MNSQQSMKRSRFMLSVVIVFFWASEYAHVPYFTPYLETLGFTAAAIGIMTGTYGMTQMILRIPLGIVTDITSGYRKVVIMGTMFTTVSSFILIFATSEWLIIFCRFLAGIASSTWIAFSVLYSAYYDASEGVTAMTNINVFNSGGKMLAFICGTIVATFAGYRMPLVVSFLAGVIAIFFALQLKTVPIQKEPMKIAALLAVFRNVNVLIPAGFAILEQLILHGTVFSFTSSVAKSLGASRLEIGVNTALFTAVQVVAGGWIARHFVKRVGNRIAIPVGFGCLCISCAIIAFAPNVWFMFIAQIIAGIGNILLMSLLMAMTIRTVPMESKSTAMGLFQALYGIGMTIGPIMIGRIVEVQGYRMGYLVFAAVAVFSLATSMVMVPWLDRRAEEMGC